MSDIATTESSVHQSNHTTTESSDPQSIMSDIATIESSVRQSNHTTTESSDPQSNHVRHSYNRKFSSSEQSHYNTVQILRVIMSDIASWPQQSLCMLVGHCKTK